MKTLFVFPLVLICSGCASIMCGSEKTINIKSEPPQAKFTIKDTKGIAIVQGITPTNVTLKRGRGFFQGGDYTVEFEKQGYDSKTFLVPQGLETGWYLFGNAVFGGLIGIVIIDPLTGAMWDIKDVNVSLSTNEQNPTWETVPMVKPGK